MTTYTAITAAQTDADSYVDTNLIDALKNNPLAMFEGDASASAVRLQTAAIEDAAVQRVKITTATVSLAGSVNAQTTVNISLSPYSFFPMIHVTDASSQVSILPDDTDRADPDDPGFSLSNADNKNNESYDIDYRYIDA